MADAGRPLQLSAEAIHGLNRLSPAESALLLTQKQQWAREMRQIFTPRDMLFPDGNLNPEYVMRHFDALIDQLVRSISHMTKIEAWN